MKAIEFKKLDNQTYYVTDGQYAINVYVRYSSVNRQYDVDASNYNFDVKTLKEMKDKVTRYFLDGKFTQAFEI